MNKYDIFVRSLRARKWQSGCTIIASSVKAAGDLAAQRFSGKWCKVLPAIIIV